MKRFISIILAAVLTVCAASLAACGKKQIHTDTDGVDSDLAIAGDAVVYVPVTDQNGEAVTDAEGETVTEAVPSAQPSAHSETTEKTTQAGAENDSFNLAGGNAESLTEPTQAGAKNDPATTRQESTTAPKVTVKEGEYELTLSADKTEVKAGDTVTVTYHLKNCRNVACFGFVVEADKKVTVTDYKSQKYFNEDEERFDIYSNDTAEGVMFSGMITTTCDFLDGDLFTVTYTVGSSVKKGDKLTFRVVPTSFLVGDDASGAKTREYSSELKKASVTVTVI